MTTGADYDAALRAAGYTPSDVIWNGTTHVYACDGLAVRVSRATAEDALTALTLVGADMGRAPNLPVVYDVAVRRGMLVVAMELVRTPCDDAPDPDELLRQATAIGLPPWAVSDVHPANVGVRLDGHGTTLVLFDVWRRPRSPRRCRMSKLENLTARDQEGMADYGAEIERLESEREGRAEEQRDHDRDTRRTSKET